MKADAKTETALVAGMNSLLESYRNRDIDGLMALVAPDNDIFLYGTGLDEKRSGRDGFRLQAERDWAQSEALDFQLNDPAISAAGPVAWLAADGLGRGRAGGEEIEFPIRMTAVWEQQGDQWFIVQAHFSVPASGQAEGDSIPV